MTKDNKKREIMQQSLKFKKNAQPEIMQKYFRG